MLVERLASSPNPQFSRPNWVDLTGKWQFRFDDADAGIRERWFADPGRLDRTITVPYPPESELSGINDKTYHAISWYGRTFEDSRSGPDERLVVHFGAVDFEATVWVDGIQVGAHRGGHTPFEIDVTEALDPSASSHTLVVRAFDDPLDLEQPRGKQEWLPEPHVIWYHRTSGIWQPVWLEVTPKVRIVNVWWRFDAARWLVDYEVELSGAPETGSSLTIALEFEGETISTTTTSCGSRTVAGQVSLGAALRSGDPGRITWSPERPRLVGATVTLTGGAIDDVVESYMGLRTIDTGGPQVPDQRPPVFPALRPQPGLLAGEPTDGAIAGGAEA